MSRIPVDVQAADERFPHGFSCHCPPCDKLHREDEIRRLIDICRRSGVDTMERRLVDYIDALEVPKGTYNCPICGLNTPHRHESAGDPPPPSAPPRPHKLFDKFVAMCDEQESDWMKWKGLARDAVVELDGRQLAAVETNGSQS